MRLVTVQHQGTTSAAALTQDGSMVPLDKLGYGSVLELVEAGRDEWARVATDVATAETMGRLDAATLLAPLPRPPRNMFCVGVNYQSHFDEGVRPEGTVVPEAPVFFTKPWTALNGHDGVVPLDRAASEQVDWEAEIAVVIGLGGRDIPPERALDHVFGYTLANDVSARDLQLAHGTFSQWFKGKSLDGFCPMGPTLVTADELGGGEDEIHVQLRVNGVVKQDFSSRAMINSVPRIIARLSLGMALLPGDVILTGTAAGVGYWREPKEFLTDGDIVEVESEQLGVLRSRFEEVHR